MKKLITILLILCMMLPIMASAEVFVDKHPPAEWDDKDIMEVTVYRTGYSDAILLQNGDNTMLIDGGNPRFVNQLYAALTTTKKLHKLNYMFSTSPRSEHLDGLTALMKKFFTPDEFLSSVSKTYDKETQAKAIEVIDEMKIPYRQVEHEETLELGGMTFTFYRWYSGNTPASRTAIVRVQFGDAKAMFLSDLSTNGQRYHCGTLDPATQKVDIVSAPNHGKDLFLNKFLDNLMPSYVFITNYDNDKTKDIKRQLTKRDIKMGFSGEGTIHMATDGTDWYIYQTIKEF